MKKLEEWLYKEILILLKHNENNIADYLNWNKTKIINDWIDLEIDKKYNILFWNKNITQEEKIAIIELHRDFMEIFASSILRLFESDLYEVEWYNPWIDLDDYSLQNPKWKWSLILAKDLNWEEITDNTIYENFISYIEKEKTSK